MDRRIVYRLAGAVVLAAAAGYLFSLFPKSNTPDIFYEIAPVLVVGLAELIIEMILLNRQSEADRRRKRKVWDDVGDRIWIAQTPRRRVAGVLGVLGGVISFTLASAADVERTVSRLAFVEIAMALGAVAMFCAGTIPWTPRRMGRALFVIGGLFAVFAGAVSLMRPLGTGWIVSGSHPVYFLLGSAVLVFGAGLVALWEAKHLDEAPDLHAAEEVAS
jgi:hypothetical protein